MALVSALKEHSRKHAKAGISLKRGMPVVLFLLRLAFKAPDAQTAIETNAVEHKAEMEIRSPQGLLLIDIPACEPFAYGMVIIDGCVNIPALDIRTEGNAPVSALKVMIIEKRPAHDSIDIDV